MHHLAPSLRRLILLAVLAAGVLLLAPHHAKAAAIIDQDQPSYCPCTGVITDQYSWAQTYTAGVTGALASVELPLFFQPNGATPAEPLVIEIQATAPDGSPSGQVLASTQVSLADLTVYCCSVSFAQFSFAARPAQVAGTSYAIVLRTDAYCPSYYEYDPSSSCYIGWMAANGAQAGRPGWIDRGDGLGWSSIGSAVMAFRTYVGADSTPPVLTVPAGVTADATTAAGAAVTYAVSALDETDGPVAASCTPASGSTFAIGTTTVTCTAADAAGNTASASFAVTVRGAADQLASLRSAVAGTGPGRSLAAQVGAVQAAFAAGNRAAACSALQAFASHVRAQSGKSIPAATAGALLADAARIGAVIGC